MGSRVQLPVAFKGSMVQGSRVQLPMAFKGSRVQLPMAFKGSRVQCSRVQLPVAFEWFNGSIACGVQRVSGVKSLKGFGFSCDELASLC